MRTLRLLLIMASGAALALAFPRASLWPVAWVALVPLLIIASRGRSKETALAGFLFGIGYFSVLLYWISIFGYLPWVLLSIMQALFIALFGALAAMIYRTRRSWLVLATVPALWTAVEYLRSLGTYGFTWGGLAYSQADNLAALQMVSLTGPWGLTFAIVLVNMALAAERRRRFVPLIVAAAVLIAVHIGGGLSMRQEPATQGDLLVALVQGSIDQDLVLTRERRLETIDTYTALTNTAAAIRPDFIVWPETVVPGDLVTSEPIRDWIAQLARRSQAHMLVGAPHDQPATESKPATEMNGAYMFSPDGELLGSYYKVHLVPFGEFVPGRNRLPFLDRYRVRQVDVQPGEEHNLLPTATGDVGVMICFESIFPRIARRFTKDGANLLFVITNDGWFKRSAAAAQHHDFSVFRAVENRRFVLRNAATGISSIVDPYGRVQDSLDIWEKGVLYGDVQTRTELTVYSRFGDWFAYLCLVFGALGVIIGAKERKQKKRRLGRTRK